MIKYQVVESLVEQKIDAILRIIQFIEEGCEEELSDTANLTSSNLVNSAMSLIIVKIG